MTLEELILSIEVEREQALKRKERALAEIKNILAKARNEGRANLTEEEDGDTKAAFKRREKAVEDLAGIDAKLANAKRAKEMEDEADILQDQRSADPKTTATAKPAYDRVARVGTEERTYHPGNCRKGGQFLRDVVRASVYRDLESEARLNKHMQEERVERGEYLQRASGTGNFGGLVVPQYLTTLYAPKTAALRPFADVCNKHDLPPDGMTVNISRITTSTSVQEQTSENTTISPAPDIDDTLLTINVKTAAGQATLSRQAIDRGTGVEDITMDDLFRRYATNLDSMLVNDATNGLDAVSQNNDVTSTDPAASGGLYGKLLAAAAGVEAAVLGFAVPNYTVMHSRRWYDLSAKLRSVWPLINQPGMPEQVAGTNYAVGYDKGVRGVLPNGLAVVVDNNIATNLGGTAGTQDEVFVVASDECHLWEDPNAPVFIRAEQPAVQSLGVVMVLYGYFAWTFARYANATQKLTGAGLVTPTFAP